MITEVEIGDIWFYPMLKVGKGLFNSHLVVLDIVEVVAYREEDRAVKCYVTETGEIHSVYLDQLLTDGIRIDEKDRYGY